jgi:uncharacterized membrane protein
MYFLLGIGALGLAIAVPVAAFISLSRTRRNQSDLQAAFRGLTGLSSRVDALRQEVSALRAHLGLSPEAEPGAEEVTPAAPLASEPEYVTERPSETEAGAPPEDETPLEPEPDPETEPETTAPQPPSAPVPAIGGLEEAMTARWLVMLGGLAIALAGLFFVKYVYDHGWLGPAVRDSIGFVFGVALALGGEWLRRRPLQRAVAVLRPNYVPPALTAAGIFVAFASVYVTYALDHLLSPLVAFAFLALVALGAFGLSLLQGWFVALLGLVGGFAIPILVQTGHPNAWGLFPYLLVIVASCQAVVRYMGWRWLAFVNLAGATGWVGLWFLTHHRPSDLVPVGGFLLLIAGLFLYLRHYSAASPEADGSKTKFGLLPLPELAGWIAACLVALLVFPLVRLDAYSTGSLVLLGMLCLFYLATGRRQPVFDGIGAVAAFIVLALMAAWHLPEFVSGPQPLYQVEGRAYGEIPGPIVPPELLRFLTTEALFAALFGIGGFVALWGARRPAMWAGVSAAVPVLLLVVAYWRIVGFGVDLRWATVALGFAGLNLIAAMAVARHRDHEPLAIALGFYAAAVVAFVSLGVTMTLRDAWLTVALSVQLPALAWIASRTPPQPMRILAAVVAVVVMARLTVNYNLFSYPLASGPLTSWVIYGYGVPALMFFWAARLFRRDYESDLTNLLYSGALVFAVLLVTFEIRLFAEGSLDAPGYTFLEQSLQSIAWLSFAYGLTVAQRRNGNRVALWGGRILLGAAVGHIVLFGLLISNPVFTHDPVGDYPIVNGLLLAYAAPAAFMFALARFYRGESMVPVATSLGVLGLVLTFVYVSLEVKRAFQGPALYFAHRSDAEFYAYSVAWIALAGALLALGIYRKLAVLRYASLAVLLVAVAKVFVFDMADLTGLFRVASFLGLGLALVGIGYVYQRFVFPTGKITPPGASPGVAPD